MNTAALLSDVWSFESLMFFPSSSTEPEVLSTSLENKLENKWSEIVKSIGDMRSLQNNWDGEGAIAPQKAIVDTALALIDNFRSQNGDNTSPDRALPSIDGRILIEWHLENSYMEAEIVEPGLAEWMFQGPNQEIKHEEQYLKSETEFISETGFIKVDAQEYFLAP